MNTFLMRFALVVVGTMSFAGAADASNREYSEKCDNYSSIGFASKDACLEDGRWHVVFETNAQGGVVYGSVDLVEAHMVAGADFKVVAPNQRLYFIH